MVSIQVMGVVRQDLLRGLLEAIRAFERLHPDHIDLAISTGEIDMSEREVRDMMADMQFPHVLFIPKPVRNKFLKKVASRP